jgi:hypothetical protein
MASAESGMTEMDDEVFIKEFVSTKKDAEGETTSKVRLRQNALMKYKREFCERPLAPQCDIASPETHGGQV